MLSPVTPAITGFKDTDNDSRGSVLRDIGSCGNTRLGRPMATRLELLLNELTKSSSLILWKHKDLEENNTVDADLVIPEHNDNAMQ